MPVKPFPRSFWVAERLLAGHYPGDLPALKDVGVERIIDLTEEHELEAYTDQLDGIEHTRLSIPDFTVPAPEHMTRVLDTIDEALAAGRTTYLHCWGGIGRTGTVVGCFLKRRGASTEEALERLEGWRQEMNVSHRQMPETPEQRALIESWQPGA